MSAMFSWAISEGLITINPAQATRKRFEKARERVLTPPELRLIWLAAGYDRFGVIIKLLMLSAQRLREISDLEWKEVDFDAGMIVWPGSRTKNGTEHSILITPTMRRLLSAYLPATTNYVFTRPNAHKDTPFDGMSRHKKLLDERIAALNNGRAIAPWVLHDIRRSVATSMAEHLGTAPHVVETILNHQGGFRAGVAGIYNRSKYGTEKAEALQRWDEHLTLIVHDRRSVVTPMRGRA